MKTDTFQIFCPNCNQKYDVPSSYLGLEAECEECSTKFIVKEREELSKISKKDSIKNKPNKKQTPSAPPILRKYVNQIKHDLKIIDNFLLNIESFTESSQTLSILTDELKNELKTKCILLHNYIFENIYKDDNEDSLESEKDNLIKQNSKDHVCDFEEWANANWSPCE